jgi:hypothetical protein
MDGFVLQAAVTLWRQETCSPTLWRQETCSPGLPFAGDLSV